MSPETTILLLNAGVIALAYALIYPRFAGANITKLAWYDVAVSLIPLGIAWFWYADSGYAFNMVLFETNWFLFTAITYFVLEMPMSIGYLRHYGVDNQQQPPSPP
jgi:hypothetical protein